MATIDPKLSFSSTTEMTVADIRAAIENSGKLAEVGLDSFTEGDYSDISSGDGDTVVTENVYFILFYDAANNNYKVDTDNTTKYRSAIVITITGTNVTGGGVFSAIGDIYGELKKVESVSLSVGPRITTIESQTLASFAGDNIVAALEKPTDGTGACTAYYDVENLTIYRESTTPNEQGGYGLHDYLFISTSKTVIAANTTPTELLNSMYTAANVNPPDANQAQAKDLLNAVNAHTTDSKTITVVTYIDNARTDSADNTIDGHFHSKKLLLITP